MCVREKNIPIVVLSIGHSSIIGGKEPAGESKEAECKKRLVSVRKGVKGRKEESERENVECVRGGRVD